MRRRKPEVIEEAEGDVKVGETICIGDGILLTYLGLDPLTGEARFVLDAPPCDEVAVLSAGTRPGRLASVPGTVLVPSKTILQAPLSLA